MLDSPSPLPWPPSSATLPRSEAVLFEPWSLGDAVIAASALPFAPGAALACHPSWLPVMRALLGPDTRLVPVSLPYTRRDAASPWRVGDLSPALRGVRCVYSARGDVRDALAARRLFPDSRLRAAGWLAFASRHARLLDAPFSRGWLRVENRYGTWARLLGQSHASVAASYQARRRRGADGPILIHVGTAWRSKQFPHVRELWERLGGAPACRLATGPGDVPPELPRPAERLADAGLLEALRGARLVIANDSAPMHLSAAVGTPTLVVARTVNIQEWLPPGVAAVSATAMPRGYRPHPRYRSHETLRGWPSAERVAREALALLDGGGPA